MSRLVPVIHVLTIPNGQTASNAVAIGGVLKAFCVFAPSTLPETVAVQLEPSQDGTDYRTLQSGGADVTVGAGKAVMIMEGAFSQLRLLAGGAVAAERVFRVSFVME